MIAWILYLVLGFLGLAAVGVGVLIFFTARADDAHEAIVPFVGGSIVTALASATGIYWLDSRVIAWGLFLVFAIPGILCLAVFF